MFIRKRKLEGSNVFAHPTRLRGGGPDANPVQIDYYVAGLPRISGPGGDGFTAVPDESWKAIASLALFVAAVALMVAIVAVIVAVRG
ncbi:hypothetical protein [Allosphingosinicella deserti]|uniref:Uncharacterized protein n=1 Tax=Allosphingosinicella deserti TaxID=2116704 RepID=A0A2P7QHA9_9SPHN|nr:hypothetical protein [Sphingomonas deserti]PSJ37316.1 hypothetical protein C7I55_22630 [Sphingomonas deserti]